MNPKCGLLRVECVGNRHYNTYGAPRFSEIGSSTFWCGRFFYYDIWAGTQPLLLFEDDPPPPECLSGKAKAKQCCFPDATIRSNKRITPTIKTLLLLRAALATSNSNDDIVIVVHDSTKQSGA